jgi:Dolichyl-phosphate-mannose-protein mannosyltransferase
VPRGIAACGLLNHSETACYIRVTFSTAIGTIRQGSDVNTASDTASSEPKEKFPASFTFAAWALVLFGVLLRSVQYAFNRSLWIDEVWLALNIVNRSLPQLFERLDYAQAAPPGFLVVEKLAVDTFGNTEYVLRLFPFVCGVTALFLFYAFTRRHLRPGAALVAVALFAVSRHLVNYASQVKQYSCDLLFAVAIIWCAFSLLNGTKRWRDALLFGLLGAVAVWLSHPAAIVLAGAGSVLWVAALRRRDWDALKQTTAAIVLWVASFLPCFWLSIRDLSTNDAMIRLWHQGFMPFPPTSVDAFKWYPKMFFEALENPVGLTLPALGALMLAVGAWTMLRSHPHRFFVLAIPIGLMLCASWLQRYPALGRFLLFAVPAITIWIAEGVAQTWRATKDRLPALGVAIVILLFARPVLAAGYHMYRPHTIQELRPAMVFVEEHYRPGDLLLLHQSAKHCFEYYAPKHGLEDAPRLAAPRFDVDVEAFFEENEGTIKGSARIWFVYAAVNNDMRGRPLYLERLGRLGSPGPSFEQYGSSAHCFVMGKDSE